MFKVGDRVTTDIWLDTGLGEIISISEANGRLWVRWQHRRGNYLHKPGDLIKMKDPNELLKEIL